MSRLTDLIAQAKAKDPTLGADLEAEIRVLQERRPFGLNFERHQPEAVELPGRAVRKGDKVRVLPPRGQTQRGNQRLWRVNRINSVDGERIAHLEHAGPADTVETQTVLVDDVVVVAEFRDPIYPGLRSTGQVERGGADEPFHTVINAEETGWFVWNMATWALRDAVNISAMALAALSLGTRLVAMVLPMEKNTPCARPVSTRAATSVP